MRGSGPHPGSRRSPLSYFGGKSYLARWIVPWIPARGTYVEVFGGSGAVLFALRPHPQRLDVYNDRDGDLVGFFRILRDPATFPELVRRLAAWPYSRAEWLEARATWAQCADPIERAVRWFVVARQSFSGAFGRSWGHTLGPEGSAPRKWVHAVDALAAFHARLRHVQVECLDWADCLEAYDSPTTCFYLDPPYHPDTRRGGGYRLELTAADHDALVARCLRLQGTAILSGYPHPCYAPLEAAGWHVQDLRQPAWSMGRTRANRLRGPGSVSNRADAWRTERLWIHPRLVPAVRQLQWEDDPESLR